MDDRYDCDGDPPGTGRDGDVWDLMCEDSKRGSHARAISVAFVCLAVFLVCIAGFVYGIVHGGRMPGSDSAIAMKVSYHNCEKYAGDTLYAHVTLTDKRTGEFLARTVCEFTVGPDGHGMMYAVFEPDSSVYKKGSQFEVSVEVVDVYGNAIIP